MSKKKQIQKKKKQNSHKNNAVTTSTTASKMPSWVYLGVVCLITAISFLPIKDAGFVNWDDQEYVTENPYIQDISAKNIATIFLSGIHPDYPDGIASNYHPFTFITLMANFAMTGMDASSYHYTNLLFHLLNTFLLWQFLRLLFGKQHVLLASLGALIFAIHPMHVESVAWISERKDVLFATFYLLGLNHYIKHKRGSAKSIIPVYFYFIGSLLSKPSAVVFPVILVLLDYALDDSFDLKKQVKKAPFFILSVIFGLITISIQTEAVGDLSKYSFIQKIMFGSYGSVYYVLNYLLPVKLATFHPYPGAETIPWFISMAPIALAAFLIIVYLARKSKWVVLGIGFYFANILLTLQFIQIGPSLVSDRYTYMSYIGLIIITVYLLRRYIFEKNAKLVVYKIPVLCGIGLWLSYFSIKTFQQTQTWENGQVLWSTVLKKFPGSTFALRGRGSYHMRELEFEQALINFEEADAIQNDHYDTKLKLGLVHRNLKSYDKALDYLNAALAINAEDPDAYNNRGNVYFNLEQYDKALDDYQKSLELDPEYTEGHANVGAYHFTMKDYDKSAESFTEAIRLAPGKASSYLNRSVTYLYSKQYNESLTDVKRYLIMKPDDPQAHYYGALALENLQRYPEALAYVERALRYKPTDKNYSDTQKRILKSITKN